MLVINLNNDLRCVLHIVTYDYLTRYIEFQQLQQFHSLYIFIELVLVRHRRWFHAVILGYAKTVFLVQEIAYLMVSKMRLGIQADLN